ncbi:MAG: hypothetical protein RL514_189 [Verrucomicrobiota bacterium]|jgi:hypothetical protein
MKTLVDQHGLADLCAAFGVSPSGYYAWGRRKPGPRQCADAELGARLCAAHAASRQTYGSPRLREALRQQGQRVGRRRVRRLMRQNHLQTEAPGASARKPPTAATTSPSPRTCWGPPPHRRVPTSNG